MPSWLKHFVFVLLLVVFAGCAGSCSGCSGCGMTPLPGGFPNAERVENSSSLRVTDTGFQFISANIANLAPALLGDQGSSNAGVLTFEIPKSSQSVGIGNVNICPDGPNPNADPPTCTAEVDLGKANLTIATKTPSNITVTGTLAVRLRSLPIKGSGLLGWVNSVAVLTKGALCSPRDYVDVPLNVDISLEVDTDPNHVSRKGYTKVKIVALTINNTTIENSIRFCGGGFDDTIMNALKGVLIGSLVGGLTDTIQGTVEEQLCTKEDPGAGVTCPTATYPDSGGTCRYCVPDGTGKCPNDSAECVAMALGVDGNINLSQMLSSISPGTKGGFDFLAALGGEGVRDDGSGKLWGDLNPIAGGMTIGMMGGAIPQPVSQCVPIANLEKPTGIPVPDELLGNTVPGWTGDGPHFGAAVSERYMNFVLGSTYNSGALCLGVGPATLGALLNSDTLGLLIPSFKDLARQKQRASLALMIRPQKPPSLVVGNGTDLETDPLLKLSLDQFNIDFYIWSNDRFIRAFSSSFDIVAPVNLDVSDQGELVPVLDKVEVNNPKVFNADLLREDEATAASALASIIAGQVGSALGGAINPINLNDQLASLGLTLNIPPSVPGEGSPGLTKLEKGSDRFLGLFASFGVATPSQTAPLIESGTQADIGSKQIDVAGLSLPTITAANRPRVEIVVSSTLDDGSKPIEYQVRLDGGFWKPWTTARVITLDDPLLSLQMRHRLQVRSRVVGLPQTVDRTPVELEILIDKTAPEIALAAAVTNGEIGVEVTDVVSPKSAIEVRWALDDAAFGAWTRAEGLETITVGEASSLRLEARDEEGNLASSSQALIRGKEDASLAAGSGCGCAVPGAERRSSGQLGLLALCALGLGMFARRRRSPQKRPFVLPARRARLLVALPLMAIGLSWSGCSCGDDSDADKPNPDAGEGGKPPGACPAGDACSTLVPGLVGAYASAAVAADGKVWVAAYDDLGYELTPDPAEVQLTFGDLVVGQWDGTKVDWNVVDGIPAGEEPDPFSYDIEGFRLGVTTPGDDVGLWTSIAIDGGAPRVAYFDATNRALKFAAHNGSSWAIHTVEGAASSDIGRYAKLRYVAGKPVIAYMAIRPGSGGAAESAVRIATASSATPAAASDWTFTDAVVDAATPCNGIVCGAEACRADTLRCEPKATGCSPKCSSNASEECFDEGGTLSCRVVLNASSLVTYPESIGLYVSLLETPGGLGVVYYDRIHGNLMAVRQEGGTWQPPLIVDGQGNGPDGPIDTGDVGMGASAFVDGAGDWHIAYANGFDESLRYVKLAGGTTPGSSQIVDDGVSGDGNVVVGDDTSIRVTASGEVQIAYQNATTGEARWATGTESGGTYTFTKKVLQVSGFAGGFNQVLEVGGKVQVMTWWRIAKPRTEGDITFVSP
jgi:hypothetical protein